MKLFSILLFLISFSKLALSQDLFETNEQILKFESYNITSEKEKKINQIKINSFHEILNNMLTKNDFDKIYINNISFINKFILNLKINDEKIINNNYYSKIKVNYNKTLIINYLIENKINFVDYLPSKFLIIILEQNEINNHMLSNDNNFYKYLNSVNDKLFKDYLLLPNLDYNDRYTLNKSNFLNNQFEKNNLLNKKYKTDYQILVHSTKENGLYITKVYLLYKNQKYEVSQIIKNKLNYKFLFNKILSSSLDKWKQLNSINPMVINMLDCKISISNIHELSYVRKKINKNNIVKKFNLKTIKLNDNSYQIIFYGNIDIFKKSLRKDRLNLSINDNFCNIKLI